MTCPKTMLAAALALTLALPVPGARAEMAAMDEAEQAAWAEAYGSLPEMTPKWGVQGAEAFKASSDAGVPVVYLDVRMPAEWEAGTVEGAVTVALPELPTADGMAALPEDKSTIMAVYCKSGHRSALAIPFLHRLGYVNAVSMKGGYEGWVAAGYPVEGAAE